MVAQADPPTDAKTGLQEWAQRRGLDLPLYRVASREGPPHAPVFVIEVAVGEQSGTGTAGSKRVAEQAAAEDLLRKLVP
jgi:ribonuclease-3